VEDGGFAVGGVGRLQFTHFLLEGAVVRCVVLIVLAIDFRQCIDVGAFARGGLGICIGKLLRPLQRGSAGRGVAVIPEAVIVAHGNAPLRHGARRVALRHFHKG